VFERSGQRGAEEDKRIGQRYAADIQGKFLCPHSFVFVPGDKGIGTKEFKAQL
jgi:hypothetical protein